MGGGASVDKAKSEAVTLLGKKLLKGGEEVDTESAFEGKKAVALYFSAHWCPPCRGFTPKLKEFYEKDLSGKGLEIVFVSSDRDEDSFKEYYAEMPWLALPYGARDLKAALSKKFNVQGIPALIVLNTEDASLITKDGRSAVMQDPTGEKLPWIPPTFAEALGESFLKGDGTADKSAIEGKTLGLYFSAHWCPPCRMFTPELAKWYAGVKEELKDKFEIVFCSGDRDEESMKSYYKEQCDAGGDWLCMPYSAKDNLDPLFEIQGIPTFLIVGPDGKVINKNGRALVPEAKASDFPWSPPLIGSLEAPDGINGTPSICIMLESCKPEQQAQIIEKVTPIAEKYAKGDSPEFLFFVAKKSGDVSSQVRSLCKVEGVSQSFKNESSPEEAPKLVRSISSSTPTVILLNLDEEEYNVGRMAEALDGSNIQAMIDQFKAKSLKMTKLG